jgi:hypothetical protein
MPNKFAPKQNVGQNVYIRKQINHHLIPNLLRCTTLPGAKKNRATVAESAWTVHLRGMWSAISLKIHRSWKSIKPQHPSPDILHRWTNLNAAPIEFSAPCCGDDWMRKGSIAPRPAQREVGKGEHVVELKNYTSSSSSQTESSAHQSTLLSALSSRKWGMVSSVIVPTGPQKLDTRWRA